MFVLGFEDGLSLCIGDSDGDLLGFPVGVMLG